MKKLYKHTILVLIIAWSTNLFATDYMISGAGSSEVNGTYIPDGTNDNGNPRWKLSGEAYYLHSDGYQWVINDYPGYAYGGFYRNMTTSDPDIPPTSGWETDDYGVLPAPTIGLPGSGINYSIALFTESSANDGSINISQPIIISHNNFGGNTFTGYNGDNFVTQGKVIVTNLSPGLTPVITRTSDTTLSVILTGNASTHNDANDVLNLTFAFQDAAFSSGDASSEGNAIKNDLEINYFQEYNIGIGGDYTSITAVLAAFSSINSDGNILNLATQTFTEKNLNVSNITIRGQGAESTIVQAAASQGIATGGVFIITNEVILENLTVRHGKTTLGGGINNKGFLTINNCSITNNDANLGGGIFNQNPDQAISLIINNSTISNNVCTSSYGSGIILYAGDILCIMTNCTVFGNTSNTSGNEGALVGWATTNIFTIINSTIAGNDAGLFSTYGGKFVVQNSIISGNNSKDYRMLLSGAVTDNGYNVVENQTTFKFNNPTSILYSHDYLGNVEGASGLGWNKNDVSIAGSLNLSSFLADNSIINGTQTLALSAGSFAIDAGISIGSTTTDQRGLNRNGATDIGSFEYDGLIPSSIGLIITGPNSETGLTSNLSISENQTVVYTFTANETVTWSLGNTNDEALLSIDANGNLVFTTAPDFENPLSTLYSNTYNVEVIATDASNNSTSQTITITIVDVAPAVFSAFDSVTKTFFDDPFSITPPISSNSSPITFTSSNTAVATVSGTTVTNTGIGSTVITAYQGYDASYDANTVTATLTIVGVSVLTKNGAISNLDPTYIDQYGKIGGATGISINGIVLQAKSAFSGGTFNGLTYNLVTSTTGKVWLDRNLGATQVATSSTDAASYGDLYQWGRGTDGHEKRTSTNINIVSTTDTPGHGFFINANSFNWQSPVNSSLWQGVDGKNNPCPRGFRLPTIEEFEAEVVLWSSQNAAGALASSLKLPIAGRRHTNGSIYSVGSNGMYRTTTASILNITSTSAARAEDERIDGFSVRCIKD